jgi:hypothetical protein
MTVKTPKFTPLKHASLHAFGGADAIPSNDFLLRFQKHLGPFWFNNNWLPSGMVSSVVSGSGSISWSNQSLQLVTGATSGSYALVNKMAYGLSGGNSWGKTRYLGAYVYFTTYSAQYAHLVSGGVSSPTSDTNTSGHIGFKLIGNSLYGTVADGTTEATLLLETLTAAGSRRLECVLTPGVECRFYVNGADKGAITTNLPTGATNSQYMLYVSISNTEAVSKNMYIYEWRTLQGE